MDPGPAPRPLDLETFDEILHVSQSLRKLDVKIS
jgi:hypothetical protein